MGTNVPDDRNDDVLRWFRVHLPLWETDPGRFGISSQRLVEVKAALDTAEARTQEAFNARSAAVTATYIQNTALADLSAVGRDTVNMIKAFITAGDDESLWADAGLVPPDRRGTAAAPTAPTNLSATLRPVGVLTVRWKARQPKGVSSVVYVVRRAIGSGPWVVADIVGSKRFDDAAVPVGTPEVRYMVQARRGTRESPPSAILSVQFGALAVGVGAEGSFSVAARLLRPAA